MWEFKTTDRSDCGVLTTSGGVLFTGTREGYFFALDAKSGKLLWRIYLGGQLIASLISYEVDGQQYVSIAAGAGLFTFGLPSR